ncbi:MAG: GYF domain-containing protein [Verrucomicrobiota bacterium]|jgi:hypothetical protein
MADYTIIGGDQKQYGPVSEEDLRKWIADGRLNAQTLVQAHGDIEWKPLSAFPEFAAALAGESAMPSAPPSAATPADWLWRDYELDIGGCISRGWELVKNNFWPIVGITALIMLITVAINQVFGLFTRPAINAMIMEHRVSPRGILTIVLVAIVSGPIYTIFMAGLFKYYLKLIRGESAGIGDAFSGFGHSIGQLVLLSLIMNILTIIGYVLCLVPGIYLAVAWFFSIPLVIDRQMGFWQAMELSRKMVNKHWFLVFAFLLVYGLLVMAGIIACCIGIFVTLPIGLGALMYAYETIFSQPQAS